VFITLHARLTAKWNSKYTNEKRWCKACKTIIFKLNIQIQDILIAFIIVVALSPYCLQINTASIGFPNTQVSVSSKCATGQQERKHKATTNELTTKLKVNKYQSQFLTTKELKYVRMSGYE